MARILIVKLGALGDAIIASAAVQRLVEFHGQDSDQVELLTSTTLAPLFDSLAGLKVHGLQLCRRSLLNQGLRLRRQGYRRVYDLQGSDRSRLLVWLSGAPERVGLWPGWPYRITPQRPRQQRCHPFQRINEMLAAVDCAAAPARSPLRPASAERERVQRWLQSLAIAEPALVLMHPGGSRRWMSKRWGEGRFRALALRLERAGMTVVWIGGEDERELLQRLSASCGVNACGAFTVRELLALGERARFAVTNDSAPMHALAAAGLPVYGFFGPTDWRLSHAPGQAQRVLSAGVACSPCFSPRCPRRAQRGCCMSLMTPHHVLTRLRQDARL